MQGGVKALLAAVCVTPGRPATARPEDWPSKAKIPCQGSAYLAAACRSAQPAGMATIASSFADRDGAEPLSVKTLVLSNPVSKFGPRSQAL